MKEKGFSLVEILIYIALIGGTMLTFFSFVNTISNSRNKVYAQEEVQANARMVMTTFRQIIKKANNLNVASSTFDVHPGILSLEMDDSNVNPTIFLLEDGVLYLKEGNSTSVAITGENIRISNLVFNNLSGSSQKENIKINLGLEFRENEDIYYDYSTKLETAINLRQ
jgi:type II secretory pathway pseudopilin PulG